MEGQRLKLSEIAKLLIVLMVGLFSALMLYACGGDKAKKINKIIITQSKVQLVVGASEQLTLTLSPSNASNADLVFASADTSVATVSKDGIVTGVASGETTVSVTATVGGASAVVSVVVFTNPVTLDTVTNVKFDGEKVVWDRVDNNYGYAITLNGAPYLKTIVSEFFTDFEVGIENVISVRALGNGKAYLDAEDSAEFTFTQLAAPSISIEQRTISITPNSNASVFEILLNGETYKSRFTSLSYIIENDLDAGFYAFKVRALGNTYNNTYNSNFSNTITVTKLAAPIESQVEDKILTFKSVVGAQSYNIKIINNDTGEVSIQPISATSTYVKYDLGEGYQAGTYNVYVMAVGDQRTTLDSAYSSEFAVDKLSKPQNVDINNGVITWDEVANATGYALRIEYNGKITTEEDLVDTHFDFASKYIDSGVYSLSVTATGGTIDERTKFVNSESSEILSVTKLAAPQSLAVKGDNVTWGAVELSYGYIVRLDDTLTLPIQTLNYIDFFDTATQTFVAKKYTISTKAVGNNKEVIDSEYSQNFEFRKLKTIDESKVTLSGGIVTWQGLGDAILYDVFINDANEPIRVSGNYMDFSTADYDSGSYSIKIRAISTDTMSVSGEKSAAITFEKLSCPTNFEVQDGVLYYTMASGASYLGYNLRVGSTEYASIYDEFLNFDKYLADGEEQLISLQAIGNGQNTISSNFSEQIKLHKISSDVGLKVENGNLSWDAQDGATGYEIEVEFAANETVQKQTMFIDGANVTFINLMSSTMFANAGDYDITVRAVGMTSKITNTAYTYDITSKASFPVSAKKLASVETLKVESGLITWEPVDGVTYYEVILDGSSLGSACGVSSTYVVAGSAGTHTVSVIARGNQTNVLDSTVIENQIEVKKLTNVFALHIKDAQVMWDGIVGANSYDVEVVDENNIVVKSAQSIAATSYTFYGLDGGTSYYVRVKANGNNSDTVSGDFGAALGAKTFEVKILAEPRNIRIENNILRFDYVANATKYEIVFSQPQGQDTHNLTPQEGETRGTFDIAEYLKGRDAGNYTIFMRSVDDSAQQIYLSSSYTKAINIEKLGIPVLSVVNGMLNYTKVYSAVEYEIGIKKPSETQPTIYKNRKDVTTFEFGTQFTAGEYYISITALGNGSSTFSSETSEDFTIEKLRTPIASTAERADLEVKNGQLYWKAVENATLYSIYVYRYDALAQKYILSYGTQLQPKEENWYLPTGERGTYQVSISVKGDDTKYVDSDVYVYNKALKKLNAPNDLGVLEGKVSWMNNADAVNGYELIVNDTYIAVGGTNTFELNENFSAINYTIRVRSVGNNDATLTSDASDPISASKLEKVVMYIDDGVLSWDNTGARAYNIIIVTDEGVECENFETTEFKYTFEGIDSGYYYVKVRQLGSLQASGSDGFLNSDVSDEFAVYKMDTPENLHINSDFTTTDPEQLARAGYLEWNAVENTSKYFITYTYQTVTFAPIDVVDNYYRFDDDTLFVGEYEFAVRASGETVVKGTKSFACVNSDPTKINAAKLAAPKDLSVANGVFRWSKAESSSTLDVRYMFCYYFAEDGQEFDMDTINVEYAGDVNFRTLNKLGKYKLLVYAVGVNCIQSDKAELGDEYQFDLFSEGSGAMDDPYIIKTFTVGQGVTAKTYTALQQLNYLNYLYDKSFKLMEDITIDSTFVPLGTLDELSFAKVNNGYSFEGVLDGNGHTIAFDSVNNTTAFGGVGEFGLFSSIAKSGIVRNLTLRDFVVSGSYHKIGIVAASNSGVIRNVTVITTSGGGITSAYAGGNQQTYVGGIAGENTNTGTIVGCVSQILINATNTKTYVYAGGIVGYNLGVIKNSETRAIYGSVNPIDKQIQGTYAGGIAGYCVGVASSIESCKNVASINATPSQGDLGSAFARAGGIAGMIEFNVLSTTGVVMPQVLACYNMGLVNALASGDDSSEAGTRVGGIVGLIAGGTISTCYNVGTVYIYNSSNERFNTTVGGIVGWNTNSEKSFVYNSFYIDGVGIPRSCTQTIQTNGSRSMALVTSELLKAESGTTGAVIDLLNEVQEYFAYIAGNYPKLIWES